ncbi:MAG: hypothetical protein CL912_28350 [Deltaproteobacteria bacterium]|nr:hypothetical protein [Deltaproteobacteria bacterium]
MRKYSGLMKGDDRWGDDCLSGDEARNDRWHVGHSDEKEGDEEGDAPRRINCLVCGSRMTMASSWRLE